MIPSGWTIKRADKGPFKRIELSIEHGRGMRYVALVDSLARNPENMLYMLADDLLKAQEASDGVALPQAPSFGIEAMLAACVPGGSTCDPQQVADAIRAYFAADVRVDHCEQHRYAPGEACPKCGNLGHIPPRPLPAPAPPGVKVHAPDLLRRCLDTINALLGDTEGLGSKTQIDDDLLPDLQARQRELTAALGVSGPVTGWKTDKLGSSLAWPADTSTDGVPGTSEGLTK